jgi:hypothetical protein
MGSSGSAPVPEPEKQVPCQDIHAPSTGAIPVAHNQRGKVLPRDNDRHAEGRLRMLAQCPHIGAAVGSTPGQAGVPSPPVGPCPSRLWTMPSARQRGGLWRLPGVYAVHVAVTACVYRRPRVVSAPGAAPLLRRNVCHRCSHHSSLPGEGRSNRPEPLLWQRAFGEVKQVCAASQRRAGSGLGPARLSP